MRNPTRADQLLAHQHGVISNRQAVTSGMSPSQIGRRLEAATWIRVSSGVYAVSTSLPTWERQLQSALLSHPGSLAAGRSAGFLHGFDGLKQSKPEILIPFGGNGRSPLARVIRSRHFDAVAVASVRRFPITTRPETILTMSLRETPATIERLIDSELVRKKIRISDFDPILERLVNARQPGLGALRRIVRSRDSDSYIPPTTVLEKLLYGLLDVSDLPPSGRQIPISYESSKATVDAYIPEWKMIVEADGRRWHTREADFERDRARDNAAGASGLIVMRFTYTMLSQDPSSCLHTLKEAGRWRQAS